MSEMQGVGDQVDNRTPHGRISGRMQLWSVDKRVTDAMATEALKALGEIGSPADLARKFESQNGRMPSLAELSAMIDARNFILGPESVL